jgi:prepilin-type N-terminal cleavage/methylation domain-containing protein
MNKSIKSNRNESGFTLFEILIALTLIAGSLMALHNIYLQLVSKKIQLSNVREELIRQSNRYEISLSEKNNKLLDQQKESSQK